MINDIKYEELLKYLKNLEKVVVAFSGGVDSTFLIKACKEALGNNVKAVTIKSPYIPMWEIDEAVELTTELGVEHEIIEVQVIDEIKYNPKDRCYLCKKAVFGKIISIAKEQGYNYVIDGTNYDDIGDYRPGLKALSELAVKSPLLNCKMTKSDIRRLSKELGLNTWDKPAYACLLTRIPYDTELKIEEFAKIEKAERYMMEKGFRAVRVRSHGDLARIEVDSSERKRLCNEELMTEISKTLKEIGYRYVTMDLDGYKMGSFNA